MRAADMQGTAQNLHALLVFASCVALASCAHARGAPAPNMARSVLLTDYVQSHGARCLDGSPQRIWLQLAAPGSANASKWYFHFMGGGWCESTASCTSRAYDPAQCYRGSSSEARQSP